MASKKPPNNELVAICKLEFYRKQKNWKFSSEERKTKESKRKAKASKVKLNKTYSIEPAPEKVDPVETKKPEQELDQKVESEEQPDLNEAFVETGTASELDEPTTPQSEDKPNVALEAETDNKPSSSLDPPGSPYSPRWSIQHWAERCRLWNPEPSPHQDSNQPKPQMPLQESNCHTNLDTNNYINQDVHHFQEYPDHNQKFYNEANHPIQNYPSQTHHNARDRYIHESFDKFGPNVLYYNRNLRHRGSDRPQSEVLNVDKLREWEAEHDWELCAGEGAAWVESNWLQGAAVEPEGARGGEDARGGGGGGEDAPDGGAAEGALLHRPDDWLRRDALCEESRCDSLPSVASDEFVRGATLAPHSTQIDLLPCPPPPPPRALSGAALARAVARHAAALQLLLSEARRRDQSPQLPKELYSFDEIPVRDPGPAGPEYHSAPIFNDAIVASSYTNKPDLRGHTELGRGRGRLKIIGIGMGRPYRL